LDVIGSDAAYVQMSYYKPWLYRRGTAINNQR